MFVRSLERPPSGAAGTAGPHRARFVCSLVGVEALVGWLLDHADVQATDLSDADTGSEECSDEEGVDDLDDMAYAVVSAARAACLRLSVLEPPLSRHLVTGPYQTVLC